MKINNRWTLSRHLKPYCGFSWYKATKSQLDSVAIYHKTNEITWHPFRPIVFADRQVISEQYWSIDTFYEGLRHCLAIMFTSTGTEYEQVSWTIRVYGEEHLHIKWGCRTFTLKDICTMMEIMEYYYTDKQLGR